MQTLASDDSFKSAYKISNNEYHIDHSHVTGEIRGHVHHFCTLTLKECAQSISCFARNMFGFDLYFIMKRIRISTWGSENLSIGGCWCWTKVNYANYDNVKFTDAFKYFQTTLSNLSSTTEEKEKKNIESVLDFSVSNIAISKKFGKN